MKLFFLRHGLAGEKSAWHGDDAKRPLTTEGITKMKRTAKTLAALDLNLDVIVTSPLVRAKQTAEIVAKKFKCPLVEDQRLALGFNDNQLKEILLDHPETSNVMLVGHEPDFSETISTFIGGGRVVCEKDGLARVDLPNSHSKHGELKWLMPSEVLIS